MSQQSKTKRLVLTGVLAAISVILYFIEFPVIPGSGYLMLDLSDLPAVTGGILMGPGAAVVIELIKVLIHVLIKGMGSTMGFGDLVNFIVGVALTVPLCVVWRAAAKRGVNRYAAVAAAGAAGMASMVAVGVIANFLIAPPYFRFFLHIELSGAALWAAIGSATILNLVKSFVIAVLTVPVIGLLNKRILKV